MLEQLKLARKRAGYTQEDVAGILGETQTFVSKIERGERRIDPVELTELAAIYQRPIDFFLLKPKITKQPPKETTITLPGTTAKELEELAFQQGESTQAILHKALKAYREG